MQTVPPLEDLLRGKRREEERKMQGGFFSLSLLVLLKNLPRDRSLYLGCVES